MLNIKERQAKLKELGYYTGAIDGIEGKGTKSAYKKLQQDYFTRKKDIDGCYGNNTDILLNCAYNCKDLKHFKLKEFKCQCGGRYCTGYPAIISYDLVHYLDNYREMINSPMTITSGMRCAKHNKAVGGATLSRHKSGKAIDYTSPITNQGLEQRKRAIDYWVYSYPNARYGYCNGYYNDCGKKGVTSWKTMGSAVHVDVK